MYTRLAKMCERVNKDFIKINLKTLLTPAHGILDTNFMTSYIKLIKNAKN